jgi:hypothetical protein
MREDIHSPAEMNPEDYKYQGWIYQGSSEAILECRDIDDPEFINYEELRGMSNLFQGNWNHKGTCDHCGAHFAWGNVYLHTPTDEKVVVGWICAEKFNLESKMQLIQRQIEKRAEAYRKRQKVKAEVEKYRQENPLIANILDSALAETNSFIADVKRKLDEYGSLTDRQGSAVIASAIKDYWYQQNKAAREAEQVDAQDVPEGKGIEVKGIIISTRYQDSKYAYGVTELKMLVQDDRGFRVWGTMPTSLENDGADKGSRIQFVANIEPSEDDSKFGFFKRPRKAEILS